ncbi:MAG: NAAT family transporter [Candidatus Omnitrophica bacterium]|nr:NAAT family transporter [Candidatus Omnitrophota bacterium]
MLLDILRPYFLAFIPIFIAIDIIGNIPSFLSLTEKFSHKQKKKITRESILYALVLTIIIVLCAKYLLHIMGITVSDFKIAGGIFLIVISINLLLSKQIRLPLNKKRVIADLGIFPLTMPLIAKPALFVMALIILEEFGILIILVALILNMFLSYLALEKSQIIIKLIGERGIRAFSRIFEIILSAIAIMMIRQGITEIFIIGRELSK